MMHYTRPESFHFFSRTHPVRSSARGRRPINEKETQIFEICLH